MGTGVLLLDLSIDLEYRPFQESLNNRVIDVPTRFSLSTFHTVCCHIVPELVLEQTRTLKDFFFIVEMVYKLANTGHLLLKNTCGSLLL